MVGNKWNGEYMSWWHNGKVCTKTTYKNDKLDGEWEYWNEHGTLKEKCFYKDGEKQV
jgi:antitoxin component YwqK of YwqJK toxin-antitoxin module